MRKIMALLMGILCAALLGGGLVAAEETPAAELYSDAALIQLAEEGAAADSESVRTQDGVVTITEGGTYRVTGALSEGRIIVSAPDADVTLVLENASIHCSDNAPLYVAQADHVTLVLSGENTLSDGETYSDPSVDAALFSRDDMTIEGDGSLTVTAQYNDGIASRDTLSIAGGSIIVQAKNHGIKGKDYLLIEEGSIEVEAGGDAIKATNDSEASLGYVEIRGGLLALYAQDDAISAVTLVRILGGETSITTANNGISCDGSVEIEAGIVSIITDDDGIKCESRSISPTAQVTVNGRVAS